MDRVKFFSTSDLSCGYYLSKAENIINEYEAEKEIQDINDIIELYNIMKFFDYKIHLVDWTSEDINHYDEIVKSFISKIAKFFKSITNENFISLYKEVDIDYKDNFWELIENFKVYENIVKDKFQEFMETSDVWLHEMLKCRKIIDHFGSIIRDFMLNNCSTAELLLDKYEIKHHRETEPICLPKELTSKDKETIISNYIESENPNLNYLRLIANIQSCKDKLDLSPRTLLRAKRRSKEKEKQLFHDDSGIQMETAVGFSKSQNEAVITKMEGHALTATYSTSWIEDNTEYATLLNNFIYLFEFVDFQMRCTYVNKYNQMSVFERFMFTSSQNAYTKGIAFDQMNILSLLQTISYYNELFSIGIRLEEVIEWFFKEYLTIEFNVHNFKVTMPSAKSTFLEKCTNIMPAMESVLKQFSLFVQDGEIDFDLLEIRSEHLIYKNIPSLVDRKYVYGVGDEFNYATFLLFSDQGGLGYNEKAVSSYKNFYELLSKEKFRLSDYPDYCVPKINWLVDNKYLSFDKEEYIIFSNKLLINIIKDLYFNVVISYWKYSESGRKIIDEFEKKGIIEYESSLFSRPEQDYINYFLNKSQFNNGLDLRNKYSHTQLKGDDDENKHNQNYMIFLRLFILSVIKINDDFCITDELKSKANPI
jgi:hypothetical protein